MSEIDNQPSVTALNKLLLAAIRSIIEDPSEETAEELRQQLLYSLVYESQLNDGTILALIQGALSDRSAERFEGILGLIGPSVEWGHA